MKINERIEYKLTQPISIDCLISVS